MLLTAAAANADYGHADPLPLSTARVPQGWPWSAVIPGNLAETQILRRQPRPTEPERQRVGPESYGHKRSRGSKP